MSRYRIRCPADYDDPMQSDSDHREHPSYTQEEENAPPSPTSPQLSETSASSSKRQRHIYNQSRQYSFDEAERILNDKRNRITTPTQEDDDDGDDDYDFVIM